MAGFFIDLVLLAVCVIGITAFMGPITHGLAVKLFGRKKTKHFVNKSLEFQANWGTVDRRE